MRVRDDALGVLGGWVAPDAGQGRLRDTIVAHLRSRPDGLSRDCHPAHVTAGALVLSADHREALLTLHTKAGRWFHLGGHCEPGDATLAGAALREATEESGVSGLRLDPVPLHLDSHVVAFCGAHPQVTHLDVRFLAVAPPDAVPAVSEESLDVRWWPVRDLPDRVPDLAELARLALDRVGGR